MTDEPKRRGRGRPKGTPASDAQKAAAKANQKKAAAALKQRAAERKALDEKQRWRKLEDGDITLADLTMDELIEGTTANNDGSWEGARHRFSPQWRSKMETERRRRIRQGIDKLGPAALEALEDILNDDEARSQQLAASKMIIEYQIGKVPDVVHVGAETEWDRMQQTAFVVLRGTEHVDPGEETGDEADRPALEA